LRASVYKTTDPAVVYRRYARRAIQPSLGVVPQGKTVAFMTRGKRWAIGVAGVFAVALILLVLFLDDTGRLGTLRGRSELRRQMQSPDREQRKQAAWAVIEQPIPELEELMVRGVLGGEPDAGVREAYVYALGNLADQRYFAAVETVIDADPSGYVRAAAWLAAARIDPAHFRTLAETNPGPGDPWDRLGIAQGRLFLGDVRGARELLEQARSDSDARRCVAGRALYKWLRPLLDAAGRWPLAAEVTEGQAWPPEFVDEIERRCATLDLQALADDTRQHDQAAAPVRRYIMRINGARKGLVSLLFGQ
jgi:hypothetical protein